MNRTRSFVTWCVTLAVFFAHSNLPMFMAHAQANREAMEREIGRLQVLLEALDDAAADIAKDTFDPEAVLAQTDRTPEGAFAWVRDNTHLVPYRGALRGPVGVLMDRMGNSLDRALLLQDLLTRLGYETRLARAHLDPGAASSLLSSLSALPVPAPEPGGAMAPGTLASLATSLGSDVADLQARQDGAEQARAALFDDLNRRREEQSAFLATLLGSPEGGGDSERDSEIDSQGASLRDHWWVQYREGDVWTDLDPTGLEALPGQSLGVTAETMAVPEISALPSELRHAVTVRVVVECSVAGALQEFVLVESPALLPAEVLGRRIVINHVPARSSQDSFSLDDPARLTGVLEQDKWFPVLTVGESQTYTSAFTDSCVIEEAAPPWLGEAVQGAFQGAADVLGGLGEAPASAETTDHVTAQWLEYQIEVPGQPTRLVRRQVFDLLGVTDREAGLASFAPTQEDELRWRLALLGETEILIVGHDLSSTYVDSLVATNMADNLRIVLEVLLDEGSQVDTTAAIDALTSQPYLLFGLAVLRAQLRPSDVFVAEPNVLTYHRQQTLGAQGVPVAIESFDIVANAVAVAPQVEDPFSARLRHGVLDTNIEALVAGTACQLSEQMVCPRVVNAGEMLEESLRQGVSWRVLMSPEDLDGMTATPQVRAQWHQNLSDGYVVVVPERPMEVGSTAMAGWWRIDASTGDALGIGENGWGASLTEYLYLLRIGFTAFFAMQCAMAVDKLPVSDSGKGVALVMCALASSMSFAGVLTSGTSSLSGLIMGILGDVMKVMMTFLPDLFPPD